VIAKALIVYLVVVSLVAVWMARYEVVASAPGMSWVLDRWSGTVVICNLAVQTCNPVKGN